MPGRAGSTPRARGLAAATVTVAVATALAALSGCGLAVQSADLFGVMRTGGAKPLTLVVNDGGTLRCNGGPAKPIPDRLLVVARSLTGQLDPDARKRLDLPASAGSVYRFKVSLPNGTFSFPDTSAAHRPELAKLEQFVLEAEPRCAGGG